MSKPTPTPAPSPPDIDILPPTALIHPPLVPSQPPPTPSTTALTAEESRDLITASFTHFRDDPFSFLREISLHYSGTGWRAYDAPVGQRVFYKGFSEEMKARVLRSPMLVRKLHELAERRVLVEERQRGGGVEADADAGAARRERRRREVEAQLGEVTERIVDGMICKFESKSFIRGAYFLVVQLLARAYHQGIHVSTHEIHNLRHIAALAAPRHQSLIFLPCHRSHIDYVSLQVICYRLGLTLPVVVAGDNLNFPLVGPFLQHAGAMYIRRSFAGDEVYAATVQAYIDTLLARGYNFECFIEGGRSRTGKLLPPKFGILSFILDSVLSGRVRDAYVIPVSTQYDKVIETEAYVSELLGIPKVKENLWDFLSSSKFLNLNMGRVDVRFHEPWSLRDFVEAQIAKAASEMGAAAGAAAAAAAPVVVDRDAPEVRLKVLRSLGYKVLGDINRVSVVMPTSLIGTILLTLRGRGVGLSELVRRIEWLRGRIRAKGGRVADFGTLDTAMVVERGLEVLGGLVGRVGGLAEETFYAVDRFQLSFYRNMVIHLFISETIVAAAMYTRVKQGGGPSNQRVGYADLLRQVAFLSQLFRGEFVFPTEGIRMNLEKTVRGLQADGVINVGAATTTTTTAAADGGDGDGDGESGIGYVELSEQERRCGRENFDFYCFLIWPFIESSWLAGVAIIGLTPPPGMDDVWVGLTQAQDMAQLLGKTLYHQGDLSYFEAVNKETLKNAFQRFQEEGILLVRSGANRAAARCHIAPEWMPAWDTTSGGGGLGARIDEGGRLWRFVERIAVSRREGKNRRDNASVSTRVLGLAARCGAELFVKGREEGVGAGEDEDEAGVEGVEGVKRGRRRGRAKL
ncbi:acyltransferase-domain-containing protein [Morchella snyderi]|nr:acyltransferase-domain-containing protein [Morchella snyderi]